MVTLSEYLETKNAEAKIDETLSFQSKFFPHDLVSKARLNLMKSYVLISKGEFDQAEEMLDEVEKESKGDVLKNEVEMYLRFFRGLVMMSRGDLREALG
jgi:ATP/maltotriose-dependent transcriptional regulator MalT